AWYETQHRAGQLAAADLPGRVADLQDAVRSASLQELVGNPMLLTTMAIIHQTDVGLPQERVRLYDRAVNILLVRWQKHKERHVSAELATFLDRPENLRPILEQLAYEAHQRQSAGSEGDALRRGDLLTLLEAPAYLGNLELAREFLEYIDHRASLMVGQGGAGNRPATYSFPHRTFQEYLAGCAMITGRSATLYRAYRRHAAQGDFWAVAAKLGAEQLLYNNGQQGETALLDLAYGLCPAEEPASEIDWRVTVWSGHMAAQAGAARIERDSEGNGASYLARLRARLVAALTGDTLPALERAEAGQYLGQLGDPRPEVMDVDAIALCFVPAGPFIMGSDPAEDPEARKDEQPQHEVNIPYDYWLGQFPITNAQFEVFVSGGGYSNAAYWREAIDVGRWEDGRIRGWIQEEPRDKPADFGFPFNLPNHPVVGVTWFEALAFCRWLTERWRADSHLPAGWQVTLPSEAEWEKGARGGLQIPTQAVIRPVTEFEPINIGLRPNLHPVRRYPWGDRPEQDQLSPDVANYADTQFKSASAPGGFSHNYSPYNIGELMGNVIEWTRTGWSNYPYSAKDGREEPNGRDPRVWRGGTWAASGDWSRCASRNRYVPYTDNRSVGFRILVSAFNSGP
ncbi:MAG: SUMF1/EgtB/PvdO family nonheme iron enzyme, partial [Anaerolineales bacterium]|nr:SUMF1/EgtB/PvdO family nonheme iron enzyme [Anaerolineales bacterium]